MLEDAKFVSCVFRPSGTEDVVRVYAEADTRVSLSHNHNLYQCMSGPVRATVTYIQM